MAGISSRGTGQKLRAIEAPLRDTGRGGDIVSAPAAQRWNHPSIALDAAGRAPRKKKLPRFFDRPLGVIVLVPTRLGSRDRLAGKRRPALVVARPNIGEGPELFWLAMITTPAPERLDRRCSGSRDRRGRPADALRRQKRQTGQSRKHSDCSHDRNRVLDGARSGSGGHQARTRIRGALNARPRREGPRRSSTATSNNPPPRALAKRNSAPGARMTFRSIHRHGFVRIAACTTLTRIADPEANAEAILNMARVCDERSAGLAVFPELALSGYAIDDLLLQDALLDAVERAVGHAGRRHERAAAHAARRRAAALRQPHLQLRAGHPPRPPARGGAENLSAELPRVLRAPLVRLGRGHRRRDDPDRSGMRRRSAPTWSSPPKTTPASSSTPKSARTSGCRSRQARDAALAGATVLANLRPPTSPSARRTTRALLCRRNRRAASRPTSIPRPAPGEITTDLAWDGQASIYRARRAARRERALSGRRPDGARGRRPRPAAPGAHAPRHVRRQPPAPRARRRTASGGSPSSSTRRMDDVGLERHGRALPVRAGDPRAPRAGLLRGLQHPGRRARAAAASDTASSGW